MIDSLFVMVSKVRQIQIAARYTQTIGKAEIVLQGGRLNYIGTQQVFSRCFSDGGW